MSAVVLPPGPLVSSAWLAANLGQPGLAVVDVRGQVLPPGAPPPRYRPKREAYDAGHLPGASFVDWTRDIVDLDDPVPTQIAPPARFAEAMAARAIGDGTAVIAYDDYSHMFAGRLAWSLRYYGHEAVRVLDGGFATWTKEGRPVTAELPVLARASFTPRPRPALRRTADEVAQAITRGAVLLDARGPAQFVGEASAARRAGHIPTARNVPYPSLLEGPEGHFLDEARLRAIFAAVGVDPASPPDEVIVYCNGGISATVPLTALAILGVTSVSLYDGSWNEWGNDDARPLETGPGK